MGNRTSLMIHDIVRIVVERGPNGGNWQDIYLHASDGGVCQITAFCDSPLPIEGAELLALMASNEYQHDVLAEHHHEETF